MSKAEITSPPVTVIETNILIKFISQYDGCRETLNSFLNNCQSAYDLGTASQRPIIFKYILSQLRGKAEIACAIKEFNSWDQVKEFLRTQFGERKHSSHLITELQELNQNLSETVTEFSLKIETVLSQLLTDITLTCVKKSETLGRIAAMEDLALHQFITGLIPRLSNQVRNRSYKNLNEAINAAISEERLQQSMVKRRQAQIPQLKHIKKPFNKVETTYNKPNVYRPLHNTNSSFCRYCKSNGHTLEQCSKREYNNKRFQPSQNFKPNSINYAEVDEPGVDEIDANVIPEN